MIEPINQLPNCFHCNDKTTADTDFVQCLLVRDGDDDRMKVIFHPACLDEFRKQRPEYQLLLYDVVRPTH